MKKEQYEKYGKLKEEIEPLKEFLSWCGDRYHCKHVSHYFCRLIIKSLKFFIGRVGYGAIGSTEIELPLELQKRIVKVIEDYVDEKEKELEQI